MRLVLFIVLAIIVVTAAFFAFRPQQGLTPIAAVAPTRTSPAPDTVIAAASGPGAAALASAPASELVSSAASLALAPASHAVAGSSQTVDLVVAGGRLVQGPTVIRARAGERVSLRITSDADDELHLHGYNLKLHLRPNVPETLTFDARRTGRFTYELHRHDVELGALEVYPR